MNLLNFITIADAANANELERGENTDVTLVNEKTGETASFTVEHGYDGTMNISSKPYDEAAKKLIDE